MPNSPTEYICIGKGNCGSVWSRECNPESPPIAIKREDGSGSRSVTNDHHMHQLVLQSALRHPPSTPLSIPQCYELIQPTDSTWWEPRLPLFPPGHTACRALTTERIPKVPRAVSDKIVHLFCQGYSELAAKIMTNPADDACLIRPYLGRRRRAQQKKKLNPSRFQPFTLRNVPLHLDVLEDLGGQYIRAYAQTMAEALALLHWGAGIDANDVEFVLAPPRDKPVAFLPSWKFPIPGSESGYFESRFLGTHCMWILDFDCCRRMSMDDAGVEQACTAFYKNDPPYPRPGTGDPADEEPWAVFKSRFLEASRKIWGEREGSVELGLAEKLMRRIEEEGAARREKREALRSLPN